MEKVSDFDLLEDQDQGQLKIYSYLYKEKVLLLKNAYICFTAK